MPGKIRYWPPSEKNPSDAHGYQQSLSRCITCQDICVQQQAATCGKMLTMVT